MILQLLGEGLKLFSCNSHCFCFVSCSGKKTLSFTKESRVEVIFFFFFFFLELEVVFRVLHMLGKL